MTAAVVAGGNVIVQLRAEDGAVAGPQLDLPQSATPEQLEVLLNKLLDNEERIPYAFYVVSHGPATGPAPAAAAALSTAAAKKAAAAAVVVAPSGEEEELTGALGPHLARSGASAERVLSIVFRPQAIFRVRPVTRCTASIPGHAEAVLSVAFAPDGRGLASGSGDCTVRFWDVNTQTPTHTGKGHTNWVLCIAWAPDGKLVCSGGMDGLVMLWDPATGEALGGPLKGHGKWVTALAWEPAHLAYPPRRFASSSRDGSVRVWDAVNRRCSLVLTGHTLAVTCVRWGGDGLIFSASRDCTINVWEPAQGKLVRTLKGHAHWVNTLALSTELVLRTGAFDHTCARQTGSDEEVQAAARKRYDEARGGRPERLVSGSDDFTLILWEPAQGKQPTARLTGHQQLINHVVFSPDGRWLASGSFDKSVKLWDGATGKFVATLRAHVGPVYQLAWASDSRMLVSGSKDSTLKVWDMRTRKMKLDLPGHADEVFAVDWSPDGSRVASGGKDRVIKLWHN